ncbi:hypothetical protein EJ063_17310 [Vibrio aquaticus]|uniref:Lipoprotein n=1 Tax=Vibrio aquaticus TaxID=2496559 RepID=A0A3S0QBL4_9VIBR|nr:hypothetical protein [Vibrio aquaticus]RTZ14208.1 hypothetical protein EJ063_17310 [Vibrio aquaticus]
MNKYLVGVVIGLTSASCFAMGRPLPELDRSQYDTEQWQYVEGVGATVASETINADEQNYGHLMLRFDGDFTLYFVDRSHRCNGEDDVGPDNQTLPNRHVAVDGQAIEMKGICHQGFTQYSPANVAGKNFLNGHFIGNKEVKVGGLISAVDGVVTDEYAYSVSAMGFKNVSLKVLKAKHQ